MSEEPFGNGRSVSQMYKETMVEKTELKLCSRSFESYIFTCFCILYASKMGKTLFPPEQNYFWRRSWQDSSRIFALHCVACAGIPDSRLLRRQCWEPQSARIHYLQLNQWHHAAPHPGGQGNGWPCKRDAGPMEYNAAAAVLVP